MCRYVYYLKYGTHGLQELVELLNLTTAVFKVLLINLQFESSQRAIMLDVIVDKIFNFLVLFNSNHSFSDLIDFSVI